MKKERDYNLNKKLLKEYITSAFQNAADLLEEASFLLENEFYARAYFLGCASLEETGKAYISFSALGRNLENPAVQAAVKINLESHPPKIISALVCLIKLGRISSESIQSFIDLSLDLQRGREHALYSNISNDCSISLPKSIVRPKAAIDCVRLANDCLEVTSKYVANHKPEVFSSFYDKIISIRSEKLYKMINNKDFWGFYINSLSEDSANSDFVVVIMKYHDEYYCKNKKFQKEGQLINNKMDTVS
jgi:AbiV family abortive infection protein